MEIKFSFEKETKGAVRYKEQSDDPIIGSLYIRKAHLKDLGLTGSENITVEIKEDK